MINHVAHYDFTMKRNPKAQILTGPLTKPVFGYDGISPGPRIQLSQDTTATVRHDNALQAGTIAASDPHHPLEAALPKREPV